jgi:hypothetical protein
VYTEIAMVSGAIQAEIDTEWHGRPSRVVGTAVKTYL